MIRPLDYAIIGLYVFGSILLGIAFRGSQKNVDDYFAAGRAFGGWTGIILVGLSIAPISGLSLLSIPSVSYNHGFRFLVVVACLPVFWAVIHYFFLPRFFREPITHSYDVFERHFGLGVRTAASLAFLALRIGWMAALVYAPATLILTVLGAGPEWLWPVNLGLGICCTVYTLLGGIRGVIVTDAVQTFLMLVGIGVTAIFIASRLPIPASEAIAALRSAGAIPPLSFRFSPYEAFTVWAVAMGWTLSGISSYMADQMQLQRFLATGGLQAARRSFAISAIGSALMLVVLIAIGVMLRAWYHWNSDPQLPASPDRILSYFVARELPSGLSGLFIAAILAATMSAMTSGINVISGSIVNDFVIKFGRPRSEAQLLGIARIWVVITGVVVTVLAGVVDQLGTIFEIQMKIMGSFLGPLLATMLFAILRVKVAPAGVIAALVIGGLAGGWAIMVARFDGMWVVPVAFVATLAAGLLATACTAAGWMRRPA